MGRELSQLGQTRCIAVMPDLDATGLACLELCLGDFPDLAVSVLNKPEANTDCRNFIRVESVGTIVCRGSVARALKQRSVEHDNTLWKMSSILNLIGVSERHVDIYNQALKTGRVVIVLQGQANPVRQGCQILKDNSLGKPVLYLG